MRSIPVLILFSIIGLISCEKSKDFKEIRDFKDNQWFVKDKQTFRFEITDTTKSYKFNFLVRNSVAYPFFNIYLKQRLLDSSGAVLSSSMQEALLFEPKTGKPYGEGLGDIFDNKISAPPLQSYTFKKPGKYKWEITHNMRPDPLQGIMSLGVEVIQNP